MWHKKMKKNIHNFPELWKTRFSAGGCVCVFSPEFHRMFYLSGNLGAQCADSCGYIRYLAEGSGPNRIQKRTHMHLKEPLAVNWIAGYIKAAIVGDPQAIVTGLNEIHKVTSGDLTFVDFEKYYKKCLDSEARVVIINKALDPPPGKTLLVCDDPFAAFVSLVKRFNPFLPQAEQFHASATWGEGSLIQPGVFLGQGVRIGKDRRSG